MTTFRRRVRAILTGAVMGAVIAWLLFPLWWAVAFSFKRPGDFFTAKIVPFLQFTPTLANWRGELAGLMDVPGGLGRGIAQSAAVAGATALLSGAIGLLAAAGLLRRWRGGRPILPIVLLVLLPRVIPPLVIALPFGVLMRKAGLGDTLAALVLAHTALALPWSVLILFGTLREVPPSIWEAAQLDGASWLRIVWEILAPGVRPALVAAVLLAVALSWNEFPFAVTNDQGHAWTAPLSIGGLVNKDGIEFQYVGTRIVATLLPPLAVVLGAQRFVVRGLSLGAVED